MILASDVKKEMERGKLYRVADRWLVFGATLLIAAIPLAVPLCQYKAAAVIACVGLAFIANAVSIEFEAEDEGHGEDLWD